MQANKPVKKIHNRYFTFFGGIAFCLFSVTLILNVGYVARFFALPFVYLFGLCSYVFYVLIYAYGLFLFFKEKGFKIRFNNYFFGGLIIFISALMISTLIVTNDLNLTIKGVFDASGEQVSANGVKYFQEQVFNGIADGYWKSKFVNLFQGNKFGGGFLGYAIVSLLNTGIKATGTWVVSIFIFLLGAFVIFFPTFKKIFKLNKTEKAPKENRNERNIRIENTDSISSASQLEYLSREPESVSPQAETMSQPANFNNRADTNNIYVDTPRASYESQTNFAPARYSKFIFKPQPVEPAPEPAPVIRSEPKTEQMRLDFDAKPEVNQALVGAKPEFDEPVFKPSAPTPAPAPTPAVMPAPTVTAPNPEPVVRKPIKWVPPSSELLEVVEVKEAIEQNNQVAEERVVAINNFFADFRVGASCSTYVVGPAVTRYNIQYAPGVSVRDVSKLIEDVSVYLNGVTARFASIVEGQNYSGLEIPNARITTVSFKEVYEGLPDVKKHPLSVAFGKSIDGKVVYADLDEFPHLLVAGTTGSGKSIYTHSLVTTLIMRNSPEDLKLVLIDPKKVEMNKYRDLPHLLCPIINEASIAKMTMSKLVDEMNDRYDILQANEVSNIKQYNELLDENPTLPKMPYILVVIDEYADVVDTCKDIALPVVSIAQKARACGIHMLISTQRPSTNVITGTIKGNLPTRVALSVASPQDSVVIIGEGGAEKLLGKGDMLVQSPLISRNGCVRLQGCFIQNKEIAHVVGYLKQHYECNYDPKFTNLEEASAKAAAPVLASTEFQASQANSEEAKYEEIKGWVMSQEYMSISRIQREMGVGFNRAGRFFLRMQSEGIVAKETEGNKGCPVLIKDKFYDGSVESDIPVSSDQTSF